jgi:hypothetical protein
MTAMDLFIKIIILFVGVYGIMVVCFIKAPGFINTMIFKVIPSIYSVALIFIALKLWNIL